MTVADFTSTGSKRPDVLFGASPDAPQRMRSSSGCTVVDDAGREYLDMIMALGAVGLGYGHPAVNAAVIDAVGRGTIGPLAPEDEEQLASELGSAIPWLEEVRFLKSGAEAVAAAVRIARARTGRDRVIGCGYHGWLDWCSTARGVPTSITALYRAIPFNDVEQGRQVIRAGGDAPACVVVEPVIEKEPSADWLAMLRAETQRVGAVLIFDEVKTAFRVALGGASEKWGVHPDLMVMGKAIANGYPLAAVGGTATVMAAVKQTWISSTMATEFVSLAAARATVAIMTTQRVPARLEELGTRLIEGLRRLAAAHDRLGVAAVGIPQMCYLRFADDQMSAQVSAACAQAGLLFKRNAYNFVSLAHDEATIDRALAVLDGVLAGC